MWTIFLLTRKVAIEQTEETTRAVNSTARCGTNILGFPVKVWKKVLQIALIRNRQRWFTLPLRKTEQWSRWSKNVPCIIVIISWTEKIITVHGSYIAGSGLYYYFSLWSDPDLPEKHLFKIQRPTFEMDYLVCTGSSSLHRPSYGQYIFTLQNATLVLWCI